MLDVLFEDFQVVLFAKVMSSQDREVVIGVDVVEGKYQVNQRLPA